MIAPRVAAIPSILAALLPAAPAVASEGTARPVRFEAVLTASGTGGGRAAVAALHDAAAHGLDTRVLRFVPRGRSLALTLAIDGAHEADVRAAASEAVASGMRLVSVRPVTPPTEDAIRRMLKRLASKGPAR